MKKEFTVGEKVIALSTATIADGYQPRIKGKEYIVTSLYYCPNTGVQKININNYTYEESSYNLTGCKCGQSHVIYSSVVFSSAEHFARREDLQNELAEAIANEDYDKAILIRDLDK